MSEQQTDETACPHMTSCPLYPLFSMQALLEIWKSTYCRADFQRCERHRASSRNEPVPADLLPNGTRLQLPKSP